MMAQCSCVIQYVRDWFKAYSGLAIYVIAAYYSTEYFVQLTELVAAMGEWCAYVHMLSNLWWVSLNILYSLYYFQY